MMEFPVRATSRALVLALALVLLGAAPASASETFESRLTGSLQRMLDTLVGPGRAVVTVRAEQDFDEVETSRTTFTQDPSAGAVSESRSRETWTGGGTSYQSTEDARVTALNEVQEIRRDAPGDITKLTVAVLVDATAAAGVDLAEVERLISAGAGIDLARGDVVTVVAMPFGTTAPATVAQPSSEDPIVARVIVLTLSVLAVVLLLLLLAGRRKRNRAARLPMVADSRGPIRAVVMPDRPRELPAGDPARTASVLRRWLRRPGS